MNYEQLHKKQLEESSKLPMYWAFTEKQFNNLLCRLNAKEEDFTTICGALILKKDETYVTETLKRHKREMKNAMENIEFFKSAIIYEMRNHEYAINYQGDYDVCHALGFHCPYECGDIRDIEKSNMTERQKRAYKEARREYLRLADKNEWY